MGQRHEAREGRKNLGCHEIVWPEYGPGRGRRKKGKTRRRVANSGVGGLGVEEPDSCKLPALAGLASWRQGAVLAVEKVRMKAGI